MKPNNFADGPLPSASPGGGGGGVGTPVGGDLGGSIPDPIVIGFNGLPLCPDLPAIGDAYIWDGTNWCPAPPGSTGTGMVPYYIAPADTFTVPLYKQALFKDIIENDGILVVLGRLLGVD